MSIFDLFVHNDKYYYCAHDDATIEELFPREPLPLKDYIEAIQDCNATHRKGFKVFAISSDKNITESEALEYYWEHPLPKIEYEGNIIRESANLDKLPQVENNIVIKSWLTVSAWGLEWNFVLEPKENEE